MSESKKGTYQPISFDKIKIGFLRLTKQIQDNNNVAHEPIIRKHSKEIIKFHLLNRRMNFIHNCWAQHLRYV